MVPNTLQARVFLSFALIANPPPPPIIAIADASSVGSTHAAAKDTVVAIATAVAAVFVNEKEESNTITPATELTTAAAVETDSSTTIESVTNSITTWTNNLWTSTSLSLNQTWNRVLSDIDTATSSKETVVTKSRSNSLTSNPDINTAPQSDPIGVISMSIVHVKMVSDALLANTASTTLRISLVDSSLKKPSSHHINSANSISWNGSASKDSAGMLQVNVAHYRTAITVEVALDSTGRVLGQGKICAYQIMQQQADLLLQRTQTQRIQAQHAHASRATVITIYDSSNKIVAFLESEVGFKEDFNTFFWSSLVKSLPASADEEVSIDRLGTHVARFRAMINCFTNLYRDYLYLMEWKDPMLTSFIFLLFLYCTIYVQSQYSLSGLLCFIMILMTRAFLKRRSNDFKNKFLHPFIPQTPLPYMPVVTMKVAVLGYQKHGYAGGNFSETSTAGGFNLLMSNTTSTASKSRVLLSAIKVSYLPDKSHFSDVASKKREVNVGVIACFGLNNNNSAATSDSKAYLTSLLSHFISSDQSIKASDALLFNIFDPWPLSKEAKRVLQEAEKEHSVIRLGTAELSLVYPIALNIRGTNSEGMGLKSTSKEIHISPSQPQQGGAHHGTSVSMGASIDPRDKLCPSPNQALGQAQRRSPDFFFSDTATSASYKHNNANSHNKHLLVDVNGKIKLTLLHNTETSTSSFLDTSIQETVLISLQDVLLQSDKVDKEGLEYEYIAMLQAQETVASTASATLAAAAAIDEEGIVSITEGFLTPQKLSGSTKQSTANNYKNEVLVRINLTFPSSKQVYKPTQSQLLLSRVLQELQLDRGDKESSTFSVLWNVRDHVKHAQNLMAWILDCFESGKNLLNWTLPLRTLPLYLTILGIWVLTICITSQHLILIWGLYQFLYVILPIPEGNEITKRFCNLLQSIPNDDDLMDIYAEERKKFNDERARLLKIETTEVLLQSCLSVQWTGSMQVRCHRGTSSAGSKGEVADVEWMSVYMVLQGHRLVWWMHEEDVGKGNVSFFFSSL